MPTFSVLIYINKVMTLLANRGPIYKMS